MSFGTNSQKSSGTQTSNSNSQSSTRPTAPNELADYFWMMDSLTGGYRPQTGGITYNAPVQAAPARARDPLSEMYTYYGALYTDQASAEDAWRQAWAGQDHGIGPGNPMAEVLSRPRPYSSGTTRGINSDSNLLRAFSGASGIGDVRDRIASGAWRTDGGAAGGGSWSYNGQSYATREAAEAAQAADQSRARDGRLATWAKEGTREVGYGGIQPYIDQIQYGGIQPYIDAVAYDQLTPEQLRALGGAGATRELQAGRVYGDQMARIRSDPRLSVFQGQRSGQEAGREYQGNLDAIGQEVEALLTQVAQQERAKSLEAATSRAGFASEDARRFLEAAQSRAGFASEDAKRYYDAAVRNANLTREDMALLAQMLQGFKGQYATSTSTSSGSGSQSGSGSGFNIGLW